MAEGSVTRTIQDRLAGVLGQPIWLLALDPGETTGGALFCRGRLVWCDQISLSGPHWPWGNWNPDQLVIEIPNAHESKGENRSKRDPQAIITLAITCGQWIRHVSSRDTVRLYPSVWKGQVPKRIHNERVLECLDVGERALIPKLTPAKLHNVIDAVGLGLFQLGRMQRGRAA